jgi:hypothetical protein
MQWLPVPQWPARGFKQSPSLLHRHEPSPFKGNPGVLQYAPNPVQSLPPPHCPQPPPLHLGLSALQSEPVAQVTHVPLQTYPFTHSFDAAQAPPGPTRCVHVPVLQ